MWRILTARLIPTLGEQGGSISETTRSGDLWVTSPIGKPESCFVAGVENWLVINGHISPVTFCAIELGKAMFRDAHHYFSMISKNVEAYGELANELDDGEFLTDPELFTQVSKLLMHNYGTNSLRDLTKPQKLDLARMLRQDFHSSNGQIRRVLGLTQYDVDSLFPLSAK